MEMHEYRSMKAQFDWLEEMLKGLGYNGEATVHGRHANESASDALCLHLIERVAKNEAALPAVLRLEFGELQNDQALFASFLVETVKDRLDITFICFAYRDSDGQLLKNDFMVNSFRDIPTAKEAQALTLKIYGKLKKKKVKGPRRR